MLRFLSTGESHGQALVAVLDGFPAGVPINIDLLNKELQRRQQVTDADRDKKLKLTRLNFSAVFGMAPRLVRRLLSW